MVDKRRTAKALRQFAPKRTEVASVGGVPLELPNHSGYHTKGLAKTPTEDFQIANKKYVDDSAGTHTESSTDSLTNKTIDSFTNDVEADEIHIQVRNESGSTMSKGDLVYISGYSVGQDKPLISLADANGAGTYPALAMINDSDIANNATGHATVSGRVFNIDTNAFSVGDTAYLSDTAGELSTKPTGTSQVQAIGIVLRKHASNGVIELIGAGRTNDLPNLPDAKIWIGDSTGVPREFALSGDVSMTSGGNVTVTETDPVFLTLSGPWNTHIADNTQAHSDYLLNDAADVGVQLTLTADSTASDSQYTAQVLHSTGSTPPTASGFPIGTVYLEYTA